MSLKSQTADALRRVEVEVKNRSMDLRKAKENAKRALEASQKRNTQLSEVGLYKLNAVDLSLESASCQALNL